MIARFRPGAARGRSLPLPDVLLVLVVLAAPCLAEATVPRAVRWAASPLRDAQGRPLPPPTAYEVWLSADAGPESLVATVPDTVHVLDLKTEVTYVVRVRALAGGGLKSAFSEPSDPLRLPGVAGVGEDPEPQPALVGPARPNPFNARTAIAYRVPEGLPTGARLELGVYDLRGRRVADLALDRSPGRHEATWHGTDERGRAVPAGVYLARFDCGTRQQSLKLVLVS